MTDRGGNEIEVTIERLLPGGVGLGFADRQTVLVPLTAPGDRVRARIERRRGKTIEAEVVQLLEAGPDRVDPLCPYYGVCGGCDFQHLSYPAQLDAKSAMVQDCLRRIGGLSDVEITVIGSPEEWAYRQRARWQFDGSTRALGYFARKSHTVMDIERCMVLRPDLEAMRIALRERVQQGPSRPSQEWEGAAGDDSATIAPDEAGLPGGEVRSVINGIAYEFDASVFFQANNVLASRLVDAVLEGEKAVLEGGGLAVDLHCGVGLFTIPLAKRFSRVYGVEMSQRAIRFARRNAESAGTDNIGFVAQPTGQWLAQRARNLRAVDLLVMDPPRTGLDAETMAGILRMQPGRIASVSCDPATFARDLRALLDGGYVLDGAITVLDMFPQTHHVEIVAKLRRVEAEIAPEDANP